MPSTDERRPSTPHLEFTRYDLASVRDLRALILEAAVNMGPRRMPAQINLVTPKLSRPTIDAVWAQVTDVLHPEVADRLYYEVSSATREYMCVLAPEDALVNLRIDRPNYTFEVLRIIANAALTRSEGLTITRIADLIGASQSPVRRSLRILEEANLIRGYHCDVPELTLELLARVGALPQTVRLRFKQGATPRPPSELFDRARKAIGRSSRWELMSISGAGAAMQDMPDIDLMGLPRLDLCLRVQRHASSMGLRMLEDLSSELEVEPNPTAPAPVVISLPRANVDLNREPDLGGTPLASRFDVYVSLLDMGLRPQAVAYAERFS